MNGNVDYTEMLSEVSDPTAQFSYRVVTLCIGKHTSRPEEGGQ